MKYATVKTSELEGRPLDWAVAWSLNGTKCFYDVYGPMFLGRSITQEVINGRISPSTDWAQGGRLIEKLGVSLDFDPIGEIDPWEATLDSFGYWVIWCPTPLIAACRAIVLAESGDEVAVPEELL